jgi:hypothetical protein
MNILIKDVYEQYSQISLLLFESRVNEKELPSLLGFPSEKYAAGREKSQLQQPFQRHCSDLQIEGLNFDQFWTRSTTRQNRGYDRPPGEAFSFGRHVCWLSSFCLGF